MVKEPQSPPATLGDVLYAHSQPLAREEEWSALVRSIAAGDENALHELYERSHHLVFTLAMRMTAVPEMAEEVTLDVFHAIWRDASAYDPANGTVLSWIMNQAKWRAGESRRSMVAHAARGSTDILRPAESLQERLAHRIAQDFGKPFKLPTKSNWSEPAWDEVAPGIKCKLLATDTGRNRVSMLVRLAPHIAYPAHRHADTEELHLLDGELWVDGRKLSPGAYNYASPGSVDFRVYSETGCTCVLITSPNDILR